MIDNYLVKNCIVYYSTATGSLPTNISFEIISSSFRTKNYKLYIFSCW